MKTVILGIAGKVNGTFVSNHPSFKNTIISNGKTFHLLGVKTEDFKGSTTFLAIKVLAKVFFLVGIALCFPSLQAEWFTLRTGKEYVVVYQEVAPGSKVNDDVHFVRFLGISKPNPNYYDLKDAVDADKKDFYDNHYQKGACLYTSSCIQPLAANDPRHEKATNIGVAYPFALIIDPKVKLHYWSLQDMNRNDNRQTFEDQQKIGTQKFNPRNSCHHLFPQHWKTVHYTGINEFIDKLDCVAKAVKEKQSFYLTKRGKKKQDIGSLKKNHNEASITYNPEKDVVGILIKNDPKSIELANQFKSKYTNDQKELVFKNAYLAYQDSNGKIVKL